MPGGQKPLVVAGVAGGVGTSTWIRMLQLGYPGQSVLDLSVLVHNVSSPLGRIDAWMKDDPRHAIDLLVTSNAASAVFQVRPALSLCPRPPLLVVMHVAPGGEPRSSRAFLRTVVPNIAARIDISHHGEWLELPEAPGDRLPPKARDISKALAEFPHQLHAMYGTSPRPPAAVAPPPRHAPVGSRAGPQRPPTWPSSLGGPAPVIHRGSQGG